MPDPDSTRTQSFRTPAELRRWLKANHASEPELWVRVFRKSTGEKSVTWEEIVIEALCWGWIDGVRKPFDDVSYLQRVTPRRARSTWSKRNREHVARLVADGRMQEPGLVHVRAAQADGRWNAAYAPPSEMTVPGDFLAALDNRPRAKAFFNTLNRANLYGIAYRLRTAKKPETRQRRFDALIAMLEQGEKLH